MCSYCKWSWEREFWVLAWKIRTHIDGNSLNIVCQSGSLGCAVVTKIKSHILGLEGPIPIYEVTCIASDCNSFTQANHVTMSNATESRKDPTLFPKWKENLIFFFFWVNFMITTYGIKHSWVTEKFDKFCHITKNVILHQILIFLSDITFPQIPHFQSWQLFFKIYLEATHSFLFPLLLLLFKTLSSQVWITEITT